MRYRGYRGGLSIERMLRYHRLMFRLGYMMAYGCNFHGYYTFIDALDPNFSKVKFYQESNV